MARFNPNVNNVRNRLGDPRNQFGFNPRNGRDFANHDRFGFHDFHGHQGFHDHFGHFHNDFHNFNDFDNFGPWWWWAAAPLWWGAFWYPNYASVPYWWGFNYPGYYPSVYSYWGWTPGWINQSAAYYDATPQAYISESPYTYYGASTAIDPAGAQQAIADIQQAWMTGNPDLIGQHLSDQLDIRVAFDGQYAYTTKAQDYFGMTADAMGTSKVVSMTFSRPTWVTDSDVLYNATQVFRDPKNEQRTVYLSYRLARSGDNWFIVGVGSSLKPTAAAAGLTQEASAY
jgi:hypothetical protein